MGATLECGHHLFECVIPGQFVKRRGLHFGCPFGEEPTDGFSFGKVCDFVPGS